MIFFLIKLFLLFTSESCTMASFNNMHSFSLSSCPCLSSVLDLIYWKDTERTGMVFTGLVVGLLSLFQLSIITVLSTLSLAIVCFTISVRIYCNLLHALQLRDGAHPFQWVLFLPSLRDKVCCNFGYIRWVCFGFIFYRSYLDVDIGLSGDQAELYMQRAIFLFFAALDTLKRLVFVACLFDSLKVRFINWKLINWRQHFLRLVIACGNWCSDKHNLLVKLGVLLVWLDVDQFISFCPVLSL